MSEAKFTKGPWFTSYKEDKSGMYSQAVYDTNGEYVCECNWYPIESTLKIDGKIHKSTSTNREQNAHLIASAPEMYGALEDAADMLLQSGEADFRNHGIEIRNLLSKARGES